MTWHPGPSLRMDIIISSPYGTSFILVTRRKQSLKRRDEEAEPQWYRFPLTWVVRDEMERKRALLNEKVNNLEIAD